MADLWHLTGNLLVCFEDKRQSVSDGLGLCSPGKVTGRVFIKLQGRGGGRGLPLSLLPAAGISSTEARVVGLQSFSMVLTSAALHEEAGE